MNFMELNIIGIIKMLIIKRNHQRSVANSMRKVTVVCQQRFLKKEFLFLGIN